MNTPRTVSVILDNDEAAIPFYMLTHNAWLLLSFLEDFELSDISVNALHKEMRNSSDYLNDEWLACSLDKLREALNFYFSHGLIEWNKLTPHRKPNKRQRVMHKTNVNLTDVGCHFIDRHAKESIATIQREMIANAPVNAKHWVMA